MFIFLLGRDLVPCWWVLCRSPQMEEEYRLYSRVRLIYINKKRINQLRYCERMDAERLTAHLGIGINDASGYVLGAQAIIALLFQTATSFHSLGSNPCVLTFIQFAELLFWQRRIFSTNLRKWRSDTPLQCDQSLLKNGHPTAFLSSRSSIAILLWFWRLHDHVCSVHLLIVKRG